MSLSIYLYDNVCPHCGRKDEVFSANITHNLTKMADKAGLYKPVWHPEENGIKAAGDLIRPLTDGIAQMKLRPAYFKKFDAPNGWGLYIHFLPWLEELLAACVENPNAVVEASR